MGRVDSKGDQFGDEYVFCRRLVDPTNDRQVYRLNSFPFAHIGFFHYLLNILALTPLLERFEAENGSLPTLLLFTGRPYTSSARSIACADRNSIRITTWRNIHCD